MPYKIKKQSCDQEDGDSGSHVVAYTDKAGKKHNNCHTSKEKAQAQIGHIEGGKNDRKEIDENLIRAFIREKIILEFTSGAELIGNELAATEEQKEIVYDILVPVNDMIKTDAPEIGQFLDIVVGTDNVVADQITRTDPGDHDMHFTQEDVDDVVLALRANNYNEEAKEIAKIKFGKYIPPA